MVQAFVGDVYLILALLAAGSWGLYVALVVISNVSFVESRFLALRISVTAFGVVSWALFSFASYSVGVADGNGSLIRASYPSLAFFGIAGALVTGLFLIDSVMKLFGDEVPMEDMDSGLRS